MHIACFFHVLCLLGAHVASAPTVAEVVHAEAKDCELDTADGLNLLQVGLEVSSPVTKAVFQEHADGIAEGLGRVGKGAGEVEEGDEAAGAEVTLPTDTFVLTYAVQLSLLSTLILASVVAILVKRKDPSIQAFRTEVGDVDAEKIGNRWSLATDDLIGEMGLSGLCFLDLNKQSASDWPLKYTLPCLALQGFGLQIIFLGYLLDSLAPQQATQLGIPIALMNIAAVYVHFVNVVQGLLFDFNRIIHLPVLHKEPCEMFCVGFICLMDSLVVPGCTLVIGALYLCTSSTAGDLIVNAVGVAFITNIDNFIINIYTTSCKALKKNQDLVVHFPVDHAYVKSVNFFVCVCPIIPSAFSFFMYYAGKNTMSL